MPITISERFFDVELRPPGWPEDADLRRASDWLTSFMTPDEWRRRRFAALDRFVNTATGHLVEDNSGTGQFFASEDQFAWYLFLAQANLDHPTVYDFMYGSRVLPVLRVIGRNLELLLAVDGINERVKRLVGPERGQPNGALFELLVAAAYRREGAEVRFPPENPGVRKTHDLDVLLNNKLWAVECKRMELGEYTERERETARQLWLPIARELQARGHSVLAKVQFVAELGSIPCEYLARHAVRWLKGGTLTPHSWSDEYAVGTISRLDFTQLQSVLATDDVAINSSRMQELLTGQYKRNAKIIQLLHVKLADNPLYVAECDQAVVLDWESHSQAAIDGKARDVLKRLADGVRQLPDGRPGVVHISLEAVDGMEVESARYKKVLRSITGFDPQGKQLEYVYVNWFAPESPPDMGEAFDETCQWSGFRPGHLRPLKDGMLVLSSDAETREGVHWESLN